MNKQMVSNNKYEIITEGHTMAQTDISDIIARNEGHRGELISILEDIQGRYGYLPEDALREVAARTSHSMVDIYGVATFYKLFSLKPRGKHLVSVCLGTACHVRNAPMIAEEVQRQLGIGSGETTPDKEFTLETVNCLGACALGPIVVVDGRYFSKVTRSKVKQILQQAKEGYEREEISADDRVFQVHVNCPRCNHSLADPTHLINHCPSVRLTVSFGRKHGPMWLSSLYGSYDFECEHEIPLDTIVNFFCPHCHSELAGASNCTECGAPMVPLIIKGGGMVQICSRHGCKGHMLDFNGVNM